VTNRWTTNGTFEDGHGYGCLELILAGHSVTDIASQVGVRRETVWRWRNDPSFASEVSVRQGQRRQSIHDELDAGVIESMRMLRGLVAVAMAG
jgi:hypothetical protein